jgi:hypothetical protein
MPFGLGFFATAGAGGVTAVVKTQGYYGGGIDTSGGVFLNPDRLIFSTQTRSAIGASTANARGSNTAVNGQNAGYWLGGRTSGSTNATTTSVKLTKTTDAISTLANGLDVARTSQGATASLTKGYVAGGYTGSGTKLNTMEAVDFSTDVVAAISQTLSTTNKEACGIENLIHSYFAGGETASFISTTDKFIFAGETRSTLATGLSVARAASSGISSDTAGYVVGGFNGSYNNTVDKFTFATDVRTVVGNARPRENETDTGMDSPATGFGYACGLYDGINNTVSNAIDRLAFANDTWTANVAQLTNAKGFGMGCLSI